MATFVWAQAFTIGASERPCCEAWGQDHAGPGPTPAPPALGGRAVVEAAEQVGMTGKREKALPRIAGCSGLRLRVGLPTGNIGRRGACWVQTAMAAQAPPKVPELTV